MGILIPPLVFKTFSTQEITSIIKSNKTKNSSDYDEISTKPLKISANYICSPLTYICNKSVSTRLFPEQLKYSIIKPLYMKGDKTDPSNYGPISMLTSFSKVLEKALYNRLIEYLNNNNILNTQQSGFRKNLATEDAIFRLIHEILNALNSKIMVGSIFFDLAKAFDSVNHLLLIQKLPHYGIIGKYKLLLESYLTNRFQRVQLDSSTLNLKTTSTWNMVKHGVPQGLVLGPLSCLLYINDLPNAIIHNATPILFADDTSIIITGRDAHKFQDDLSTTFSQISEWFQLNSLSLNISKTHFIQFSSKSLNDSDINITYENNYISKVNDLNFLGLNINNPLSWKTHIDKIVPKLSSACFAMRAVKPFMCPQMLKAIYYSHFHSIISYSVIFWGHTAPSTRVFRLQKRIIRIMTGRKSKDSCRKLFTSLEFFPVPSLYIFSLLRFVIKNKELFATNNETHNYGTRQHLDFHYPSANLMKFQTLYECKNIQ
jgi:hypothetical protein